MAINIGTNFTFQGQQPNFERDRFATKAAMKAFPETSIDDGHLSYCAEDRNTYQFKSSNSVDNVTGKWRVFKADVDLSAYATKDSVATGLAKKVDIRGVHKRTGSAQYPIIKVMTINIPANYRYRTGFFGITLMCDNEQFTRVLITVNTLPQDYIIKAVKSSIHQHLMEKSYYWYDKINNKVIFYHKLLRNDNLTVKVTDQEANSEFTWNLDLELVDALPEGAIEVHDINYGNKNLFYATPINAAGDPTFRAINIADLPDLSRKYGTKAEITTINSSIADLHSSLESTQTDFVDLRNKVNVMPKTVFITQAAYDALTTKDSNTIYYING
nr:MAG TPA: hypothetical protein [Crassvirales sp.]